MISYEASRARLDDFFGDLPDSDDETLARAVSAQPEVAEAALALLQRVFTPPGGVVKDDPSAAPYTALASVVLKHAAPQRARFLDEVALSIANPALYRVLAQRVAVAVPANQLEAALIAALQGQDELRCANALAIQYHLYGRSNGPRLSDPGRAVIAQWVAALRARPHLSARLRAELESYTLPENPA